MDIILSLGGIFILGILIIIFFRKIKKDGGPIFFKHSRIGRDLKEFKMYKFRTMYVDAEERLKEMLKDEELKKEYYTNFKLKEDPRITTIGKFLRKFSLDEFPQFINVLKGDMSLVGPRPIVQKELNMYYGDEIGKKVFQIKPGITGMWQSHGRSDIDNYDERISSDLFYIRNWSLWLDCVILLETLKYVLYKKGAY
jgi:undecaprenyl-phosphate galactose phosphotransferase